MNLKQKRKNEKERKNPLYVRSNPGNSLKVSEIKEFTVHSRDRASPPFTGDNLNKREDQVNKLSRVIAFLLSGQMHAVDRRYTKSLFPDSPSCPRVPLSVDCCRYIIVKHVFNVTCAIHAVHRIIHLS